MLLCIYHPHSLNLCHKIENDYEKNLIRDWELRKGRYAIALIDIYICWQGDRTNLKDRSGILQIHWCTELQTGNCPVELVKELQP
jgi:hypothetical protein